MTTKIQIPVHRTTDEAMANIRRNQAANFLKRRPSGRMFHYINQRHILVDQIIFKVPAKVQ